MTDKRHGPSAPTLPQPLRLKSGAKAVLRRVWEDDAEQLCAVLPRAHRESDFLNWMPGEFTWTAQREREFIRDHTNRRGETVLCVESNGRIIALAGAHQTPFRRFAHQAEIGVTVLKDHWGQGIGRTLIRHLIAWGQAEGLRKLTLRVFEDNRRAIALYESLGFVEEGLLKEDALRADGGYADTIIMAMFYHSE